MLRFISERPWNRLRTYNFQESHLAYTKMQMRVLMHIACVFSRISDRDISEFAICHVVQHGNVIGRRTQ